MLAAQVQIEDRRWNQATVVMLVLVVLVLSLFTAA
jgi:hypothetical protein